jgi:hypothetical protein
MSLALALILALAGVTTGPAQAPYEAPTQAIEAPITAPTQALHYEAPAVTTSPAPALPALPTQAPALPAQPSYEAPKQAPTEAPKQPAKEAPKEAPKQAPKPATAAPTAPTEAPEIDPYSGNPIVDCAAQGLVAAEDSSCVSPDYWDCDTAGVKQCTDPAMGDAWESFDGQEIAPEYDNQHVLEYVTTVHTAPTAQAGELVIKSLNLANTWHVFRYTK